MGNTKKCTEKKIYTFNELFCIILKINIGIWKVCQTESFIWKKVQKTRWHNSCYISMPRVKEKVKKLNLHNYCSKKIIKITESYLKGMVYPWICWKI